MSFKILGFSCILCCFKTGNSLEFVNNFMLGGGLKKDEGWLEIICSEH